MKINRIRPVAFALATCLVLTACGMAAQDSDDGVTTWTWDHGLTLPGTAYEELMTVDLPRMMEEATDGRVIIEPTIGSTDPSETVSAVKAGRFDGGTVVATVYAGTYPVWVYGEVPFVVPDFETWERYVRGEPGEFVRDAYEQDTGLIQPDGRLSLAPVVWFSKKSLDTYDAWKGQRVRSASTDNANFLKAMGASPVTMPFAEVYTSLERDVIDGFLSNQSAALALSPWEVLDYVNRWPSGYGYIFPTVRPEALETLDEQTREQVLGVFEELEEIGWERTKDETEEVNQELSDNGLELVEPTDDELQQVRDRIADGLLDDWLERTGEQGRELLSLLDDHDE